MNGKNCEVKGGNKATQEDRQKYTRMQMQVWSLEQIKQSNVCEVLKWTTLINHLSKEAAEVARGKGSSKELANFTVVVR